MRATGPSRHDAGDQRLGVGGSRGSSLVEAIVGIILIVISAVEIVGIIRVVSANQPA